jgi:hypothetical protein
MKTALYVDEGVTQVILTPESDWEKKAIKAIRESGVELEILHGHFYECRGGWTRPSMHHGVHESSIDSLMLRLKVKQ